MINDLRHNWIALCSAYNTDENLISMLWLEIESQYSKKSRHYHTLEHLKNMFGLFNDIEVFISDKNAFLFAIWYHDIIYKASKTDNEEKSAELAEERLQNLGLKEDMIKTIKRLIVSTKKHQILVNDNTLDNHYLLDLDLSILGTDWVTYQIYCSNIRKEYSIYPTFIYNRGRKKVLENFLKRDFLYFTDFFKHKFEAQARNNIKKELKLL